MKLFKAFSIAAASAVMFGGAHATTFHFGGNGGNLGKDEIFTEGGDSVKAIAINTEEPEEPTLHQNGNGLGVNLGFGDANQIDNWGDDEAIVFDFGAGVAYFDSITISGAWFDDDIRIYGSNDPAVAAITSGGLSAITAVSTLLASANGNLFATPFTIDLSGITTAYRYLIATIPSGSGDGFRVKALSAEVVPLPAALPLLLSGLAGLGFASRRRKNA